MQLYYVAITIAWLLYASFVFFIVCNFFKKVFKKKNTEEVEGILESFLFSKAPGKSIIILVVLIIHTLSNSPIFLNIIGNDNITKKPNGIYAYYVDIEYEKKHYYVPAEIEKFSYKDEDGKWTVYYLNKLFTPDGKVVEIYEEIDLDYKTSFDFEKEQFDRLYIYDTDIRLINEKAYIPSVKETSPFNPPQTTYFVIEFGVELLALYTLVKVLCSKAKTENK